MGKRTPLYNQHLALNARMVEFAGWEMPIHYGSQLEEHHLTRQHAGLFDVSHMNIVEIKGQSANPFLQYLLANNVEKLNPGKALYSCMLNEKGNVVDDLIVYMLSETHYQLVLNAAVKEKDMAWLNKHNTFGCTVLAREDLAILALQGPHAMDIAESVLGGEFGASVAALNPFHFVSSQNMLVARTGYTGEDGIEIMIKADLAAMLWHSLIGAGAHPVGLGARDTLRLEAGLNLYGQDMDESTSPWVSNLGWTVALDPPTRHFVGRDALTSTPVTERLVGILLETGGVLRHDQQVFSENACIGRITSGGFSPVLKCSIGFARIIDKVLTDCFVEIRGKLVPAKITSPVFVRRGKRLV